MYGSVIHMQIMLNIEKNIELKSMYQQIFYSNVTEFIAQASFQCRNCVSLQFNTVSADLSVASHYPELLLRTI